MKIPLEDWAGLLYGRHAPTINTLRHWARDGRIFPSPQKIGRRWLVDEAAIYLAPGDLEPTHPTHRQRQLPLIAKLMEKQHGTTALRKKPRLAA